LAAARPRTAVLITSAQLKSDAPVFANYNCIAYALMLKGEVLIGYRVLGM